MHLDFRTVADHVADDIIAAARESAEPVVFVTGNAYMPPHRSFPEAEALWQSDDTGAAFELFIEALEARLELANVYLGCPDYDNALYAVDLARWQHIDDDPELADAEDLNDEWEPIS